MKNNYKIAASIVCGNMLSLKDDITALEKAEVEYIHFDVMDGIFVPRYGLHPESLQAITSITKIPVDVHLMVQNPDPYISIFAESGADIIAVHAESCTHLHRTIQLIKEAGVKAGVALNPATPLSVLDYVLDDLDLVMLMAINPGILGHKLIPGMMQKIKDLQEKVGSREDLLIEIDGGVTFESAPEMLKLGANMFVCGTSTIFKPDVALDKKVKEFREVLAA